MSDHASRASELPARDPAAVRSFMRVVRPWMRMYFRCEVRGMEHIPDGGALVVANHSGGLMTVDLPVFLTGFVDQFGCDRPLYLLAHDFLFLGAVGDRMRSWGLMPANPAIARKLLRAGGVTIVFPGGEYDASRPFYKANKIDFGGRSGYVRTALDAGVPIVPCVSIGGQETQLFLSRGEQLVKRLGLRRVVRARSLPISIGFPFGFSAILPPNFPLPSKITMSVLPPIDPRDFGAAGDSSEIDAKVREAMQAELDTLAAERRLPVIG